LGTVSITACPEARLLAFLGLSDTVQSFLFLSFPFLVRPLKVLI
jgi:hypothetical protein